MNKDELLRQLELKKTELANLREKQLDFQKKASENIKGYLAAKWFELKSSQTNSVKEFPKSYDLLVSFEEYGTFLRVRANDKAMWGTELSIHHKTKNKGYEMSWYSTSATKEHEQHLFYLDFVYIVSCELRKDKSYLLSKIENFLEVLQVILNLITPLNNEILDLEHDLEEIISANILDEILKSGSLKYKEKTDFYLKSNKKVLIDEIVLENETDKTIQLKFLRNGSWVETKRMTKKEAFNLLVDEYKNIHGKDVSILAN